MSRVPSIDTKRDREIARLQRLLVELEAIAPHRRDDEHADERAETVRTILRDLKATDPSSDEPRGSEGR